MILIVLHGWVGICALLFHYKKITALAASARITPEEAYSDIFISGVYYGIAVVALAVNSAFWIIFKDKKILLYILLLTTIILFVAHADGIIDLVSTNNQRQNIGILITLLFVIAAVSFSIYSIRKTIYGSWLLVLHIPFFACAVDYIILKPLNMPLLQATPSHFKFISLIEIITFLIFMLYRIHKLQQDLRLRMIKVSDHVSVTGCNEPQQEMDNLESLCVLYGLTESEFKVFKCIAEGLSNIEISKKLFISVNTVKYHNRNIYEKLDINSKSQAMSKIFSSRINVN